MHHCGSAPGPQVLGALTSLKTLVVKTGRGGNIRDRPGRKEITEPTNRPRRARHSQYCVLKSNLCLPLALGGLFLTLSLGFMLIGPMVS